jgi:hypothetical protein
MCKVGHAGGACGGSSILLLLPESEIAVAMLTNLEGVALRDVAERIAILFKTSISSL